ncbi:MAG: glycosyltransferase [Deltaproteobacteria bacterium]|nr:glycosyltransferase [Deltaproteobacteria bacterium]MBW2152208.1 glycosyltransferase [Deltaproteobacteria bacterium]
MILKQKKRIGFVFDGLVPSFRNCFSRLTIRPLLIGWKGKSSVYHARFRWISSNINQFEPDLYYEVYRLGRRYDALVFLKSMNKDCLKLAHRMRSKGCKRFFDLNVDYITPPSGTFYYHGMAPTENQREQALAMVRDCDAVIADSWHLHKVVQACAVKAAWIPDNVPDHFIAGKSGWKPDRNEPLTLLWSGEAVKLFELLRIEELLRRFKSRVRLKLVTNSLEALAKIYEPWQSRLKHLLAEMECEIYPFNGLQSLMSIYDQGGIFISPRFLDNTYNMGHTEWKIALPMARGRMVVCSDQPSYVDLAERADGKGIRVCKDEAEWHAAFDEILSGRLDWDREQQAACMVIRNFYAASIVSKAHAAFVREVIEN